MREKREGKSMERPNGWRNDTERKLQTIRRAQRLSTRLMHTPTRTLEKMYRNGDLQQYEED